MMVHATNEIVVVVAVTGYPKRIIPIRENVREMAVRNPRVVRTPKKNERKSTGSENVFCALVARTPNGSEIVLSASVCVTKKIENAPMIEGANPGMAGREQEVGIKV